MRALRHVLSSLRWATALRRLLGAARETLLWVGAIAFLQAFGAYAPHDGADLLGVAFAGVLGLAMHRLAAMGWMPVTRRVGQSVVAAAKRFGARLSPRHAVVLRLPAAGSTPVPDGSWIGTAWVLVVLTAAFLALRERAFEALLFLKTHGAYSLYLVLLAAVWTVLGGVAVVGVFGSASTLLRRDRRQVGLGAAARLSVFLAAWTLAVAASAAAPGAVTVALVMLVGLVQAWFLRRRPPATYLLCQRDRRGRLCAIPVHEYLARLHGVLVLGLVFATVLGHAHRLLEPTMLAGPFSFTAGLGLVAGVASLWLSARAGWQLLRLVAPRDSLPEAPLTRTVWVREPGPEAAPAWAPEALRRGWKVEATPAPPEEGFDLVVGGPGEPRSFTPPQGLDADEAQFRLERRFHVVKRRQFFRRFEGLHKEVSAQSYELGSGFLFCPHVWLVQGIVRDVDEEPTGERAPGALLVGGVLGRPYAEVFPTRLRRYLGEVLRTLRIDMVFWEDAIGWAELRAVFGVCFEIYDQGRAPLEERHFLGLPRVRVVIQEEDDVAATEPPALQARILMILRDRGGEAEDVAPPAPGSRRREPLLV